MLRNNIENGKLINESKLTIVWYFFIFPVAWIAIIKDPENVSSKEHTKDNFIKSIAKTGDSPNHNFRINSIFNKRGSETAKTKIKENFAAEYNNLTK